MIPIESKKTEFFSEKIQFFFTNANTLKLHDAWNFKLETQSSKLEVIFQNERL